MLYAAAVGVVAVFQLFFSGGSRLKNALRRHQICTLRTMYILQGVQYGNETFLRATVTSFLMANIFLHHSYGGKMCTF